MKAIMFSLAALLTAAPVARASQDPHAQHTAAMDHRGHQQMGFDQAKGTHTFTVADDGGTIAINANSAEDARTIGEIRTHLREITRLFKAGDFAKPLAIHAEVPPGVDVMKARREHLTYRYEETALGGKVVLTSQDPAVLSAVKRFLEYQAKEHGR